MLTPQRVRILFSIALVLACAPALAKHMYQYTDKEGIVHFTDIPPTGDVGEVKSSVVAVDHQPLIRLRESGSNDSRDLNFFNASGGPVSVALSLQQASNVFTDPPFPAVVVLAPEAETHAATVAVAKAGEGFRYRYAYSYMPGDYRAVQNTAAHYQIPFDPSLQFPVSQAFNGSFSHRDPQNRYAVDIGMPEGTPVRAARDGVIMTVDNDFYGNGLDMAQYGDRANNIRIVHADGAMSVYAHLAFESVRVQVGQHVKAGQEIALSGDTGFTSGPHLHFCVQMNKDMHLVSVPFQFAGPSGAFTPQQGQMLGAAQ
jgi:murein DD-endopeptidase MepM/ murein hydrolase activator NlpD